MRKTLRDAGGPLLERMGMAGIPALMGIDISGSLKTGIPLVGSGTPQDTIYGVYGGMAKKALNAMSAVERENYLRALEFASPAFLEAVLKEYRMSETGVTTPRGKVITDEQGKPIRLGAGEGIAQAAGFGPERMATVSGEHRTMENLQAHYKERRDDLYSRYRLARTPEDKQKIIRDMQKFNIDARKYRGVIPPITATSMGQATEQNSTIEALGGWVKICAMPEEEFKWAEKDFLKIYPAFSGRSVKAPMKLIGIFEQQNSARGFFDHIPEPVYIGDKKKALAWVENETSEKVLVENLLTTEN
jgi:hypothetical protein